jgi:hypothetical protein
MEQGVKSDSPRKFYTVWYPGLFKDFNNNLGGLLNL